MWHHAHRILFGNPVRTIRTIFALVAGLHLLYFLVLPRLLTKHKTRSPRVRRFLEWIVATPSLFGDMMRIQARHDLMRLAHMEGRHEQAAVQGYAILRHRYIPATLAAEVRGRLADALEGMGHFDEAREVREQAVADLKAAPVKDASWYINHGRQLTARNDHAGACRAYEEGLAALPEGAREARALLTLHLATALFMAGRLVDSACRGEEAAELVDDTERKLMAHRQAGASYADLGRLDDAERHKRITVELAESLGDPKRLADCLADLAEIHRKRGQLPQALAACDRAAAVSRPTRHIELIRYEIFRSWGRFDPALAAVDRASSVDALPTPRREQVMQAVFSFARATIQLEQGRLDGVAALLDSARAGVQGDAKITLWCDAASLRLAALEGRRDDALIEMENIESRLAEFGQDRNTKSGVLGNLGRTALVLGDYERALGYWQQYLELPPQPVDVPTAYYHLGECRRGLDDFAAARKFYWQATDVGLDTHYAHLAQTRLRTTLP
jgi:tetratricopeptide (TPR) repeat protein